MRTPLFWFLILGISIVTRIDACLKMMYVICLKAYRVTNFLIEKDRRRAAESDIEIGSRYNTTRNLVELRGACDWKDVRIESGCGVRYGKAYPPKP